MTLAEAREILKVRLYATKEEIKKAWRARTLETHPDRGGRVEEFKKVQEAYVKLTQDTATTNTIETEIFETIFSDVFRKRGIDMENVDELEKMFNKETRTEPEEKPIRVRKAKYPTNQKKKKP